MSQWLLLAALLAILVGCALATGGGPASVTINRYLDISAIASVQHAASAASGAGSASPP